MLLFKKEHVKPILEGRKTQTRRKIGKKQYYAGTVHLAKIKMLSREFFTNLEILSVRQEKLGDISDKDVEDEGYPSKKEFYEAFARINKMPYEDSADLYDMVVWVLKFKVVP